MVEAFADTAGSHLKVISPGSPQEDPLAFPVWRRKDPELARVFENFRNQPSAEGALEIPEAYMPFALRLKDEWGPQDVGQPRFVGMMQYPYYQRVRAYPLYEGGAETGRHVATVTPNALSRHEVVQAPSVAAAGQVLGILFDAKVRQDEALAKLKDKEEEARRNTQKPVEFRPRAVVVLDIPKPPVVKIPGGYSASYYFDEGTGMAVVKGRKKGMTSLLKKLLAEKPAPKKEAVQMTPDQKAIADSFRRGEIDEAEYYARMSTLPVAKEFRLECPNKRIVTPEDIIRSGAHLNGQVKDIVGNKPEPVEPADFVNMAVVDVVTPGPKGLSGLTTRPSLDRIVE